MDRKKLEEMVELPGPFTFRAVGEDGDDLRERCARALSDALGRQPAVVDTRPSSKGNFLSVRLTVTVASLDEIEVVYAALRATSGVRMVL